MTSKFLINIPFVSKLIPSLLMHCDSQATKDKAKSKILMKKKNMTIIHKFIRHLISHGVISLDYVRSKNNIIDSLTKHFALQQVIQSLREI